MSSCSLLLLLLVLTCLQSFTTAQINKPKKKCSLSCYRETAKCKLLCPEDVDGNGPDKCCFSYQTHRIPVIVITEYKETDRQCTKPGVIFTLKSGRGVCADPEVKWVKDNMKKIDQRLYASMIQNQTSV